MKGEPRSVNFAISYLHDRFAQKRVVMCAAFGAKQNIVIGQCDVRYWPKADIG
jgi:hypothetical protein